MEHFKTKIPNWEANITTVNQAYPYSNVVIPSAIESLFGGAGSINRSRTSGYICTGSGCICAGDADCNDMFTREICGPRSFCISLPGGGVVCICS